MTESTPATRKKIHIRVDDIKLQLRAARQSAQSGGSAANAVQDIQIVIKSIELRHQEAIDTESADIAPILKLRIEALQLQGWVYDTGAVRLQYDAVSAYKEAANLALQSLQMEDWAMATMAWSRIMLEPGGTGHLVADVEEAVGKCQEAIAWTERNWKPEYGIEYGLAMAAVGMYLYRERDRKLGTRLFKYGRTFLATYEAVERYNRDLLSTYTRHAAPLRARWFRLCTSRFWLFFR